MDRLLLNWPQWPTQTDTHPTIIWLTQSVSPPKEEINNHATPNTSVTH